jgi:hypothetical protein
MTTPCKASEAEYSQVGCDRNPKECTVCCVFHVCASHWENRDVWRECSHFHRGQCRFEPTEKVH